MARNGTPPQRRSTVSYGFQLVSLVRGDGHCRGARFWCVGCGGNLDITIPAGQPVDADALAVRAIRNGWEAHAHREQKTYCGNCVAGRKGKPMPEPVTAPPRPKPVEVKEPTHTQRLAIRNLLDANFDDTLGAYLDGMSDQRIAELANVPRIIVERVRDAAYGPIRLDPELIKLTEDLAKLRADYTAMGVRLGELAARIEARAAKPAAA